MFHVIICLRQLQHPAHLSLNYVFHLEKLIAAAHSLNDKTNLYLEPFKRQSHKMIKHTQTIRRQFADDLFECVWPFCEIGT